MTDNPTQHFVHAMQEELSRARAKFPYQTRAVTILALMEEVGELAQAVLQGRRELDLEEVGELAQAVLQGRRELDVHGEAVQVAVMALRVACDTERETQK